MSVVRSIVARIQALFAWWIADIRRRPSLIGKAGSLGIGLLLICCVCSIPIGLLNRNNQRANLTANTPAVATSAPAAAAATTAPEPTSAPEPTQAPALPTAAPEPTDTPVPPTAVVGPTQAPAASGLTTEEGQAVGAIAGHISNMGKALTAIGQLSQKYENTDSWKIDMATQITIVRSEHQALLALDVPPKIGALRAATLNATTDCNAAMDKLVSGLDNNRAADLNSAGELMASCGKKIQDVLPEIQALQ